MSFWNELTDWLSPPKKDMWDKLSNAGLGLNGVSNIIDAPPESFGGVRELDSDVISGIITRRQNAFTIVDVNPAFLDNVQFGTQISLGVIQDKIGVEDLGSLSSWRTVALSTQGTFLKIDFLPGKINACDAKSRITDNFDQTLPTGNIPSPLRYSLMQSHVVLLQFDDPNGPLIIARNGDVFNLQFVTVYMTFKVLGARFSAIAGYNASIVPAQDNRIVNMNPAFGPGHGIWDGNTRHCYPFCITTDDQSPAGGSQTIGTNGVPVGQRLFTPANTDTLNTVFKKGVAVGWITAINISAVLVDGSANSGFEAMFYVSIINNSSFATAGVSSFTRQKVVAAVPIVLRNSTGINNTNPYPTQQISMSYPIPPRFTLVSDVAQGATPAAPDELWVWIVSQGQGTSNMKIAWSVSGYTFGTIASTARVATPFNYNLDYVNSAPFPLDMNHLVNNL